MALFVEAILEAATETLAASEANRKKDGCDSGCGGTTAAQTTIEDVLCLVNQVQTTSKEGSCGDENGNDGDSDESDNGGGAGGNGNGGDSDENGEG